MMRIMNKFSIFFFAMRHKLDLMDRPTDSYDSFNCEEHFVYGTFSTKNYKFSCFSLFRLDNVDETCCWLANIVFLQKEKKLNLIINQSILDWSLPFHSSFYEKVKSQSSAIAQRFLFCVMKMKNKQIFCWEIFTTEKRRKVPNSASMTVISVNLRMQLCCYFRSQQTTSQFNVGLFF